MSAEIQSAKASLRHRMREVLQAVPVERRVTDSAKAGQLLAAQPRWETARSVLFYAPLPDELDLWPLLGIAQKAGKSLYLPRFEAKSGAYEACRVQDPDRELETGRFGILEPGRQCPAGRLNELDFILVPGVAFDLRGCRLGRGKGFYDQILGAARGTTCGVGYDEQIVPEVPVEPHDIRLNCILTPTRWVELQ